MKKMYSVVIAAALAATLLAGCGADSAAPAESAPAESAAASSEAVVESEPAAEAAEEQTAVYNVMNGTGETVTELYLYPVGTEDKGENYAADGLAADASVKLTRTAASAAEADATKFVLEFTTESGAVQHYDSVGFEVVTLNLLSVDAAAGATPIQFSDPEQQAQYQVTNTTGETVTELYLYPVGAEDKGENYAADGLAADASVTLERTAPFSKAETTKYVLEFTTESGSTQHYDSVGFEVVAINLLSVDAAAGATPIQFAPVAE